MIRFLILIVLLAACEGQGERGQTLSVQVETGTILNRNYTKAEPRYAFLPLVDDGNEPAVLFLGIENENGFYERIDFTGVAWGRSGSDSAVPGTSGWYVVVYDRRKKLVGSNYQVKFLQ